MEWVMALGHLKYRNSHRMESVYAEIITSLKCRQNHSLRAKTTLHQMLCRGALKSTFVF